MDIYAACALTLLFETPLLYLFGYRSRDELIVIAGTNIVTNLSLNLALPCLPVDWAVSVACGETAVVLAEYAVYRLAFGRRQGLFFDVLAANALSLGLGLAFHVLV